MVRHFLVHCRYWLVCRYWCRVSLEERGWALFAVLEEFLVASVERSVHLMGRVFLFSSGRGVVDPCRSVIIFSPRSLSTGELVRSDRCCH